MNITGKYSLLNRSLKSKRLPIYFQQTENIRHSRTVKEEEI